MNGPEGKVGAKHAAGPFTWPMLEKKKGGRGVQERGVATSRLGWEEPRKSKEMH